MSRCWRAQQAHFMPPIEAKALPGAVLGRLHGKDLSQRLCRFLLLVAPVTTGSWSGSSRAVIDPQKI